MQQSSSLSLQLLVTYEQSVKQCMLITILLLDLDLVLDKLFVSVYTTTYIPYKLSTRPRILLYVKYWQYMVDLLPHDGGWRLRLGSTYNVSNIDMGGGSPLSWRTSFCLVGLLEWTESMVVLKN